MSNDHPKLTLEATEPSALGPKVWQITGGERVEEEGGLRKKKGEDKGREMDR